MNLRQRCIRPLVAALLLSGGLAVSPAAAQGGFFYAEEKKDGRIYVFSQAKTYDAWRKSGEGGVGITRPGEGPDGETIVFDSEDAIGLYNFKHDRPAEVIVKMEEKKPIQKVTWKDGKTTIETDNAAISISNRVQVRYTVEDPEEGDTKGSFRVRRAKTKFEGWAFSKNLFYELQLNWPDSANVLEDANISYDFTGGKKSFMIKTGQFKVPFGRQELTSSGNQQFVDRTVVSNTFELGRDIGLQLWGLPMGGKIDWRLGVFNGNGRTRTSNDNTKYQYNGRLMFQPWGDVKYSESDFESKDKALAAFAVNFEINDPRPVLNADGVDTGVKREVWGLDAVFKYKGFSATGEYFLRNNKPAGKAEFDSDGWYLQAGYFVVRDRFEIAGRYGTLDPTDLTGGNDREEKGIAFNWFFNKHALKLQSDYRWLEDKATDITNGEFRVQTQFIF